jgi:23S rRNA (guanosine2251-2'-O)-methyltransferase
MEIIYGRNPVYETLRANRRDIQRLIIAQGVQANDRLDKILQLSKSQKIPVEHVSRPRLDSMVDGHQGVVLQTGRYIYSSYDEILENVAAQDRPPFILLLDTLQDPQNLGTLLRTGEAVGIHGVILPPRRSASVTPAVVNASSGASEHLLIAQANLAQSITRLKKEDVWVIGLDSKSGALQPDQLQLTGPLALVVGNEAHGMRQLVRKSCDQLMNLPITGKIDSLNAAVAGSIALYLAMFSRAELDK